MTQFFKTGLANLKDAAINTHMTPEFEKRLIVFKEKESQIVFLTPNINEISFFYEHYIYDHANQFRDKDASKLRVTCASFSSDGTDPKVCPICNEGLFDSTIKRTLVVPLRVIDHTPFKDETGTTWTDTPKWMMARKDTITMLEKYIKAVNPDGKCLGMGFKVSRVKQNAPQYGDTFVYVKTFDINQYCLGSPRLAWYLKKCAGEGKQLTAEQGVQEYFLNWSIDAFTPDQKKIQYFMAAIRRKRTFSGSSPSTPPPSMEHGWENTQYASQKDTSSGGTAFLHQQNPTISGNAFGTTEDINNFDFENIQPPPQVLAGSQPQQSIGQKPS
jgi:hypothetical protein